MTYNIKDLWTILHKHQRASYTYIYRYYLSQKAAMISDLYIHMHDIVQSIHDMSKRFGTYRNCLNLNNLLKSKNGSSLFLLNNLTLY